MFRRHADLKVWEQSFDPRIQRNLSKLSQEEKCGTLNPVPLEIVGRHSELNLPDEFTHRRRTSMSFETIWP